jgi:hypothetical protein
MLGVFKREDGARASTISKSLNTSTGFSTALSAVYIHQRQLRWFSNKISSKTPIFVDFSIQSGQNLSHTMIQLHRTKEEHAACNIADLFQKTLLKSNRTDDWHTKGRQKFISKSLHHIICQVKIQFVLLGFPCKSPNFRTVGRCQPDMAERLALHSLRAFLVQVRKLYPRGANIEILSDGYVFADCIGVDDEAVTKYSQLLSDMWATVTGCQEEYTDLVFNDIGKLVLDRPAPRLCYYLLVSGSESQYNGPILPSQQQEHGRLSRNMMMVAGEMDRESLSRRITEALIGESDCGWRFEQYPSISLYCCSTYLKRKELGRLSNLYFSLNYHFSQTTRK